MSTHIGKIGRLSKSRREELGERMEDGQTGKELAKWLNSLPDVQALLKEKFGGLPINLQNVTNWRRSGHLNWLRLREGRARVLRVVEDSEELSAVAGGHRLGDCLATILAAELDGLARSLLGDEGADLEKRWERFCEVHRQVSRLRRDDDRVKRTALREKAMGDRLRARGGDEKEVQGQKSEAQSLNGLAGTGGGTPPEPAGEDVCATEGAPPTQGYGATSPPVLHSGAASPLAQGCGVASEDENDDEDENERGEKLAEMPPNQDKSRQIKANQGRKRGTSCSKFNLSSTL